MKMLAALGLLLAAQDPAPSDRADLPDTLESWYKILKDQEQRGWTQEVLKRVGAVHRYEYELRSQYFVSEEGTDRRRTLVLAAQLDDAFTPLRLKARLTREDAPWEFSLSPVEKGLRLDTTQSDGTLRQWKIAEDAAVHALPSLLFFALRQTGKLAQPADLTITLLDPFTEKEIPSSALTLTVKEAARREFGEKKRVLVTPVVFGKAPPASDKDYALKEAQIDKFGRLFEASTRGGLKIVLVAGEQEATEGMIKFLHERVDPFDKTGPLRKKQGAADRPDEPLVTLDTLSSDLASALKEVEEIRRLREDDRPDEARSLHRKVLASWKAMKALAASYRRTEERERLAALRDELEKALPVAAGLRDEARAAFVAAGKRLDQDDAPGAEERLRDLQRTAALPELEERHERSAILEWIEILKPGIARAAARRELAAKKLAVTGITIAAFETEETVSFRATVLGVPVGDVHRVAFARPTSEVVINGRPYRVGDLVETEGVRVDAIWTNGARVGWKGQTRELPLGR